MPKHRVQVTCLRSDACGKQILDIIKTILEALRHPWTLQQPAEAIPGEELFVKLPVAGAPEAVTLGPDCQISAPSLDPMGAELAHKAILGGRGKADCVD